MVKRSPLFLAMALSLLSTPFLFAGARPDGAAPVLPAVPLVEEGPEIDGWVDDPAWAEALAVTGFTEVDPREGAPADPPTEVLLLRDRERLYIAFVCREPEPGKMVLNDMHRDAFQREDDAVKVLLDTFHDGKNGYYFVVSAAGSRLDALVSDNGQRLNFNWDGFWEARTRILGDRWIAECAFPFKTLAFGGQPEWGINFERYRGADRSRARWTGAVREFRVTTVSEAGTVTLGAGMEQGLGLTLSPYGKVRLTHESEAHDTDLFGDAGGEVDWRVTPRLHGALTFNTDFAETEVDARRVNLTRFSLFYPEKRDFFLEDSTYFDFGWGGGFHESPDVIPFFSRRIGLSPEGEEIPLEYGARVAGRTGPVDLGFLAVHTGEDGEDTPDGDLVVARPAWRATEELTLGALFTSGNPGARAHNVTGGPDVRYVSTDRLPGLWTVNAYALASDDGAEDETGGAYGLRSTLRTNEWYFRGETLYTQDGFNPALGFIRRPGERKFAGRIQWEPHPESDAVRKYEFSFSPTLWTEPDGSIVSRSLSTRLIEVEWHSGDRVYLNHEYESDRLEDAFEPVEKSSVPAGTYDWHELRGGISTSDTRPLSGRISVRGGGWYNGRRQGIETSTAWHPSPHLEIRLSYQEDRFRIPGPDFTTRVESLRVNYDFTPDLRLENLVQGDNVSDNVGLQSRLRWIIEDGRELFLVVNAGWERDEDDTIAPAGSNYTVKLQYAFRF